MDFVPHKTNKKYRIWRPKSFFGSWKWAKLEITERLSVQCGFKSEKTKSSVILSEKNLRRRKHDIILKNQLSSFPVSLYEKPWIKQ